MARSVSVPKNSIWAKYLSVDFTEDWEWSDFVFYLQTYLKGVLPSMKDCEIWSGREDRAILENAHGLIGISEYCGLVSVWCVPSNTEYPSQHDSLKASWCSQIEKTVDKVLNESFPGQVLKKIGTFSNGESVYSR